MNKMEKLKTTRMIPNWFIDNEGLWHNIHIIKNKVYLDGSFIGVKK